MKKLIFLAGLAIGFVIGSRAGRGPYDSLERTAHRVAEDPQVQRRAAQAKDAVAEAADSAKERLAGGSEDGPRSEGSDDADALAARSEGSASAGGDAELGEDRPLSS